MTTYAYENLLERVRQIQPKFRFSDSWARQPQAWRSQWKQTLHRLLGDWPPRCEPQPRWEHLEDRPDYVLHRVTYFTEPGLQTFALVALPHRTSRWTPRVLCLHGHGPLGVYPVMNYGGQPGLAKQVQEFRYDYGDRIARLGAVVFAPNLRGFGERLTEREQRARPELHVDPCNVNFFMQMLMGEVAITSQLHDLKVAVDLLSDLPQARGGQVGCMGLSYGGRLTMYLAAIDQRIRAAVVSGALNSYAERIHSYRCCGYQAVPGLLRYGDTAEVFGLVAPRPLAIELGNDDPCCPVERAKCEFGRLRNIYAAFGQAKRLRLIEFEGGHVFHGDQSLPGLLEALGGMPNVSARRRPGKRILRPVRQKGKSRAKRKPPVV